jgi:erythromycin esterase
VTDEAERRAVVRWIGERAHPLATADPRAPVADLRPLVGVVGDAAVVGLGGSTRGARELSLVKHRLLRLLVEDLGFRTLSLEADPATCEPLDRYVRTGSGDPRALLAAARPFWRTHEIVDVLSWMRGHNERSSPPDPLRVVGVDVDTPPGNPGDLGGSDMATIERHHAESLVRWRESTGHKIAHWGGSAHIAVGTTTTADTPPLRRPGDGHIAPDPPGATDMRGVSGTAETPAVRRAGGAQIAVGASGRAKTPAVRRAGSYLRERLGAGYLAVGLTFSHGSAPYSVPPPAPVLADAVLGSAAAALGLDGYAVDLRDRAAPPPVRAWLSAPAMARLIGPRYDPADDAAFHMAGGSLSEWFDVIVHWQEVTPIRAF